MTPPWTVRTVRERAELAQIVELQRANLAVNLSADEAREQGFVTAVHDLETLQQMHDLAPSIVAQTDTALAGYLSDEAWLVNLGVALVAIDLVARYFDVFWSALPRSVGMIGAGLLVLGIAYVLERQRKRLLGRMAET